MKILLSFVLLLLISTTTFGQKKNKLVIKIEQLANLNIPAGASLVVSYSYTTDGCMLIKETLLSDKTTYLVHYNLKEEIIESFYDSADDLYDIMLGEESFVLGFKAESDRATFIKYLKKLSKKCHKFKKTKI